MVTLNACRLFPKNITMKEFRAVFFVAVLSLALVLAENDDDIISSARAEANEFMDDLLETQLPRVLADRAERVRDFSFHIRKKLLGGVIPTHRDIHANFSQGTVTGLLDIRRKDDCKPTFAHGRFTVISCSLDIGSLRATYASSVKGFNLLGDIAHPTISVDFKGSSLNFEARQATPGNNRPFISALTVNTTKCTVSYESLGFNAERRELFREHILRNILPQVSDLFNIRLFRALHDALRQEGVSIPEVRIESMRTR